MLIRDRNGKYWRADHFDLFIPTHDKGSLDAIRRRSGGIEDQARFHANQWPATHATLARTVTCSPGHFALLPIREGNRVVDLLRVPVIGWPVGPVDIQPIAYSPLPRNCPVLFPNGIVSDCADMWCCLATFESELTRDCGVDMQPIEETPQ